VRRNVFTERRINRWNGLDQQALDVDSVNCFKSHLQRSRNTRVGFFVDRRLINPRLHKLILVWPHQVNYQVKVDVGGSGPRIPTRRRPCL